MLVYDATGKYSLYLLLKALLPTSPAMPTIFAGWGMKGSDFDFSAIITTFDEDFELTLKPVKAEAEARRASASME